MTMSNNFNLNNYLTLLKKQNLTQEDQLELSSYGALVERQICYNRKNEYFSLIKNYLAKNISPSKFRGKFLEMQKQDDNEAQGMKKDFEKLSKFSVDFELEERSFSRLIDLIYDTSMLAVEFGPKEGISEEEFEISIKNAFSKNYLNK